MNKKFYFLVIVTSIVLIFFICAGMAFYIIFTNRGSSFAARLAISRFLPSEEISFKDIKGSLAQNLSFQDVELKDLAMLPVGSVLRIERLDISFSSLNLEGLNMEVHNGKLQTQGSDPIFFLGSCKNGQLDFNIYSKGVDLSQIKELISNNKRLGNVSGLIADLDIFVKGVLVAPEVNGKFLINEFKRDIFLLKDSPGTFDIKLSELTRELLLSGVVNFDSGTIHARKTIIKLSQSKILFSGNPKNPTFDLKGTSLIEGMNINIHVRGTREKPEFKLSSDPPTSEGRLLLMLATGKKWSGLDSTASQEKVTPELASDFIDYFVFSGFGSVIAQHFGISSVSIKYDAEKKGVGVKKDLSSKTAVTYGVEQSQTKEQIQSTTQKVGGEYKITDKITLEGEREVKQNDKALKSEEKAETQDKVFLKYKKQF